MAADPSIDLDDYAFELPPDRIAQEPPAERDGGRLLQLDRKTGKLTHGRIRELPAALRSGDLLVVNETRVLPARLRGRKQTGGAAEALILGAGSPPGHYRALVRSGGRLREGLKYRFTKGDQSLDAEIISLGSDGEVTLAFAGGAAPYPIGETPLPPYIVRSQPRADDALRYQTTFARVEGSVAAPTAGLHLSEALLAALADRGVARAEVVLHVGPGTFRPVRPEQLAARRLHAETIELPAATADAIAETRARGGRIVAVGTTSVRVLESRAREDGSLEPGAGETDLFLMPGSRFRVVDALLTNFHLPRSSLLLLVAAFAGRERVLSAYAEALREDYRFYSYGDAMWIA